MKRAWLKRTVILMPVLLCVSFFMPAVHAAETYVCEPKTKTTEDKMWEVGSNMTVELTGDGGFTMTSKDGTAWYSSIMWRIPVDQIKQTPYFTITILNEGPNEEGAYMRMFFQCEGKQDILPPNFINPDLENWIRANRRTGEHTFNLLETAGDELPETGNLIFTLYVDPFQTGESLKIGGIHMSNEAPGAAAAETTQSQTAAAETTQSQTAALTTARTAAGTSGTNRASDDGGLPVGAIIGIVAGVVVVGVVITVIAVTRKKKT